MTAAEYFGGRSFVDKTFPATHPMRELLMDVGASTTTVDAFNRVYAAGAAHWLETARRKIKEAPDPRSTEMKDVEPYNSVLGELRAYGDLLQIPGYTVSSEGTGAPGPDFTLTHSASGRIVRVEVFSYPPRPDNEKKLGPMVKEYFIDGRLGLCSSAMQISVQDPFGFPDLNKPGDSTTANSISKICDRKSSEKQLSGDEISVLYFDLQSLWISTSMIEQAQPILFSPDGAMTSGAIWHAFYGKTGYPIFENASECKKTRFDCVRMQHDGHFQSKSASKANALIVAVGYKSGNSKFKRLICLENPLRPLPEDVFVSLIESTMFDRMNSRMGSTLLGELIDDRKLVSECLDRYASWHPGSTQGMRVDA